MRVGLVCPYALAVPGGVQTHVLALAAALRADGHEARVLAPAGSGPFVSSTGRALPVPYNGSVARVGFGPLAAVRVRRWLRAHRFDLLHLHEPAAPSVALLALALADCPVVATFHTAAPRSRALLAARPVLRPGLEKITARIAVSAAARRMQVEHLGMDAVEIGNGVDMALFAGPRGGDGCTVGFAGRFSEPRKGFGVLLDACRMLLDRFPRLEVVVVGDGDAAAARRAAGPELAGRLDFRGAVDDVAKARMLRGVDVFCAPQLGGESFGMVLAEAMAAGAAVVASDLAVFRPVLGEAGVLVPAGSATALAAAVGGLLADPARARVLGAAARDRAARFDWSVVAAAVTRVYEVALAAAPVPVGSPR